MLYCVLIYGIISCSADDNEDRKAGHECIGQYLKSIGKLDYEVAADEKSSICQTIVNGQIVRLHTLIENKMKEMLPNDATCINEAFNESEVYNIYMMAAFYLTGDTLPDSERFFIYINLENEGLEELKKVSAKCGVDAKDLDRYLNQLFADKKDFLSVV